MSRIFISATIVALVLIFSSCDRQQVVPNPFEDALTIYQADVQDLGLNLTIYADDTLIAGYNQLSFVLRDEENMIVADGYEVSFTPLMHMPTMTHSAPVEQPSDPNSDGAFVGAVVFIMPSMSDSYWELSVNIKDIAGDREFEVIVPVEAVAPQEARVRNMIAADDSSKLFIALVEPFDPKVGINDFELCVHQKASMMEFPAVDDLEIEIEPIMPSMGHGSPNNVHPVLMERGHYKGKVNFTMDGWWQVHVKILRQGQVIAQTEMNLTFSAL